MGPRRHRDFSSGLQRLAPRFIVPFVAAAHAVGVKPRGDVVDGFCGMRFYRRALAYFRPDWPLIAIWLLLIGISTGVGMLMAWPMAILIDSVLGSSAPQDFLHRVFLARLPSSRVGQIIGLAV